MPDRSALQSEKRTSTTDDVVGCDILHVPSVLEDSSVSSCVVSAAREKGDIDALSKLVEEDTDDYSASSKESNNDGSDNSYEDEEAEVTHFSQPLFKYSRLFGSLPRKTLGPVDSNSTSASQPQSQVFSTLCTASAIGKVILNAESSTSVAFLNSGTSTSASTNALDSSSASSPATLIQNSLNISSFSGNGFVFGSSGSNSVTSAALDCNEGDDVSALWQQEALPIIAMGYQDGRLDVMDATTATSITNRPHSSQTTQNSLITLQVNANPASKQAITGVSIDATGTQVAAIDQAGMCCVFDLKFKVIMRRQQRLRQPSQSSQEKQKQKHQLSQQSTSSSVAQVSSVTSPPPVEQRGNALTSFMAALTGGGKTNSSGRTSQLNVVNESTSRTPDSAPLQDYVDELVPTLSSGSIQVQRISYPKSFGRPSCLALDPAYKRRREKSIIVGFADGRLVLTKRGMLFQRRSDAILYQSVASDSVGHDNSDNMISRVGIQAIVWRGSLVAWADASGVRLLDTETLTRIAHIDRPTGARPSLYPTISNLQPKLCFESNQVLLVAWGDCLLSLRVQESTMTSTIQSPQGGLQPSSSQLSATQSQDNVSATHSRVPSGSDPTDTTSAPASPVQRRRTVECTMAWQLDCVACGLAPLDAKHVIVLGLVPPVDNEEDDYDDDDINEFGDTKITDKRRESGYSDSSLNPVSRNNVELQVISRLDGSVVYSDLLPILRPISSVKALSSAAAVSESAATYHLLSTFALPRMDNLLELQEEERLNNSINSSNMSGTADPLQLALFNTAAVTQNKSTQYIDPHLKWSLDAVFFDKLPSSEKKKVVKVSYDYDDDTNSVDSDDYGFIFDSSLSTHNETTSEVLDQQQNILQVPSPPALAPIMMVCSGNDLVLARLRDVDDFISSALSQNMAALALKRALTNIRQVRRYKIDELVDEYLAALLMLPKIGADAEKIKLNRPATSSKLSTKNKNDSVKRLSLRRMKLAAQAMPILIGGNVDMWQKWLRKLEEIPGALFVVQSYVPVRDPILPKEAYARLLENMLLQLEDMTSTDNKAFERLKMEAEAHFLNALIAWGTTSVLKEYIKLYQSYNVRDDRTSSTLRTLEGFLVFRCEQTSANYLQIPAEANSAIDTQPGFTIDVRGTTDDKIDALYDIDTLLKVVGRRISKFSEVTQEVQKDGRVMLDASARLNMMKGSYDDALRSFLSIGVYFSTQSFEKYELEAVSKIQNKVESERLEKFERTYSLVLSIIESHHQHGCLLDASFLSHNEESPPPLFALLRLVGLDLLGDFLIENCVAPQPSDASTTLLIESPVISQRIGERCGTLPLDLVAAQLESSPSFLCWYLHLVFTRKPEVYVKFPYTINPLSAITRLHRKQIELYIKFAGENRNSRSVLAGTEAYRIFETSTPLLSFLKVVLQLGGIQPAEVGKLLEVERKGGAGMSETFALELAYILEQFGEGNEEEARLILDLYLRGCSNLMLAVSFSQRTRQFSSALWEVLIDHCLKERESNRSESLSSKTSADGSLFRSLMEAAALSGADLAKLVTTIPHGMSIEGLRLRLVAAVADYRFKLAIHESATEIATSEKTALIREEVYRARRGVQFVNMSSRKSDLLINNTTNLKDVGNEKVVAFRRTRNRPDRYHIFTAPSIR